jgi:putative chitinase
MSLDRPYFTQADFATLFPRCKDPAGFALAIEDACALREISTERRIADFLGQCGHETNGFTVLVENLNYGKAGLLSTFGKYFTPMQADDYARDPERIANHAYANRMGNGNEASGDGWRYRGRGFIQLTGYDNYLAYQEADPVCGCVAQPDLLLQPRWAARSSAHYWQRHGLNELSDAGDFAELTKRINRAKLGIEDRREIAERVMGTMFA